MEPESNGVICVDFDGTLFPFAELFADNPPIEGAVEAMRDLKAMGYTISVYSSRMSQEWAKASGEDRWDHFTYIQRQCDKYDIVYDDIAWDKIRADFYIDDRAVTFRGDWSAAVQEVMERA